MDHTVTTADVKRIHQALVDDKRTPQECRQGTRTEVHALIQEQNPSPLALGAPSREFNVSGIVINKFGFKVHDEAHGIAETAAKEADLAVRKAALFDKLTAEQMIASEKARAGVDGTHRDAVHFVQKEHSKAVWAEADRLVSEALGGAS